MKSQIFLNHEAMSQAATRWLTGHIRSHPASLLCLATGGTPARTYELLAGRGQARPGDFRRVRVLKLDEWGGLEAGDPATSEAHLQRQIVQPLRLERRYQGFRSRPKDPAAECARIGRWLQEHGPIDLCVLGLGINGHLAFNEPAQVLRPHAHVARLSSSSLGHAMVKESRRRPRFGLTLGMADLLHARRILLLVSGPTKRRALARLLKPEISPLFPASFLWLHPQVTLFCDRAAMAA